MSERTMEKARQVVHRLSEWYFAEGGDNDPDSPIDREDLDVLHDLVRTPRGEGEAWRAFLDALDEFEAAANLWVDPEGPSAEDMARLDRARQRVIECARALATIRPEAQGEEEPVAWLVERRGVEMFGWHPVHVYLGKQNAENVAQVLRDGEWDVSVVPLYRATRRSEAQGEDRWEDLVFGPIVEAYNEAHAARRGEGGGE